MIRLSVKSKLIHFIIRLLTWIGLLSPFLSITDKWVVKRNQEERPVFPFIKKRKRQCFQVLLYHRVNDEHDPYFGGMPVRVFEMQMKMLRKYFNVLPLAELMKRVAKDNLPANSVAITFDDGYRDNYKNAFPILKRLGLSATIFLTTGALDLKTTLWHDRVFNAFRRTNTENISIDGNVYALHSISEKRGAMNNFLQDLRKYTPQDRDRKIQQLIIDLEVSESPGALEEMLNWEDIRLMLKNNISFGAHTVTHPILTQMALEEAVEEILTSKNTIEKELKTPVRLFAYPNGSRDDFNENIKGALKESGFLCGVTTLWGNNDIDIDPYELRRVQAWGLDPYISSWRFGWYKFSS